MPRLFTVPEQFPTLNTPRHKLGFKESLYLRGIMANLDNWRAGDPSPMFFGRDREMDWLFSRFTGRYFGVPIVICGPPGIGKTTLLKQFLSSVRLRRPPLALTTQFRPEESLAEIYARSDEFYGDRYPPEIVAIDDAEVFDQQQLNSITHRVLNFKQVRALIFVTRRQPDFARANILQLQPLSMTDAQHMLRNLLGTESSPEDIRRAASIASGSPRALGLVAQLVRGREPHTIDRILRGEIYDIGEQIILPEQQLIKEAKPKIMLANDTLIERLRQQPGSIYELPPRKFEELVADLLTDLGYEVDLTPTTHDGGKDILAQMTTPLGRLLCLVETKKYRADRPVGVELIRQLYGTLIDANATSAMLVTTSYFSPSAKTFQQRHKYRLSLRDYGNVVRWIDGYKKN